MSLDELPSTEQLKNSIALNYMKLELNSNTEAEKQKNIIRIQKDLKDFIREGNTKLFEERDRKIIFEAYRKMQIVGGCLLIPGFVGSLTLGTLPYSKFSTYSFGKRSLVRASLIFVPILCTYIYSYSINERVTSYIEYKYAERVQQFLVTKDPKSINPSYESP